jgi:hypothetical protein
MRRTLPRPPICPAAALLLARALAAQAGEPETSPRVERLVAALERLSERGAQGYGLLDDLGAVWQG